MGRIFYHIHVVTGRGAGNARAVHDAHRFFLGKQICKICIANRGFSEWKLVDMMEDEGKTMMRQPKIGHSYSVKQG